MLSNKGSTGSITLAVNVPALPRITAAACPWKGGTKPFGLVPTDRTHQTSPIVKEPENFTNSYPYEAILGVTGASWGVLPRFNYRRWLKKFG